jgi:hypothetical protein
LKEHRFTGIFEFYNYFKKQSFRNILGVSGYLGVLNIAKTLFSDSRDSFVDGRNLAQFDVTVRLYNDWNPWNRNAESRYRDSESHVSGDRLYPPVFFFYRHPRDHGGAKSASSPSGTAVINTHTLPPGAQLCISRYCSNKQQQYSDK